MWVCWYGNDLNKQDSFPWGKNYFATFSFSFFLLLYLTNIGILFPSRCRDAEQWRGRKGMRFHCLYLTGVYVASMKTQAEAVRQGWLPWGDRGGMPGTTATSLSRGREVRGVLLWERMPWWCLTGEQWCYCWWWWWWAPVQPGRRGTTLWAPPFCWKALGEL